MKIYLVISRKTNSKCVTVANNEHDAKTFRPDGAILKNGVWNLYTHVRIDGERVLADLPAESVSWWPDSPDDLTLVCIGDAVDAMEGVWVSDVSSDAWV